MNITRLISLAVLLALVAACSSTHHTAPVIERNDSGKTAQVPPARIAPRKAEEHGYYTVKKGDTLQHIALDFGQNYRDLVNWNNLANPNDIKVDQVLRVLPPDVGVGDVQLASVPDPSAGERAPLAPAIQNKSLPHGEKRPYSEAALAELQKPDALAAPAVAAAVPAGVDKPASPDTADEAVSWMWPVDGKLADSYDEAKKGIDIAGRRGQHVLAAASGKVLYAGAMRGYGNLVVVKHSGGLLSVYAHNNVILVTEGQVVSKGQVITEMGDSDADSVKLHFEIRQQGKPVDPTKFLPAR